MIRKPPSGDRARAPAPGCALVSTTTQATTKMIASTGNAYRSKACTRLCPKKAITSCAATTMTRHRPFGQRWYSACSASAPLTLLTANQPMPATSALMPAGRMLPQEAERAAAEHHLRQARARGPQRRQHAVRDRAERRAEHDRRTPPARTSARRRATPRMPTPTVANSMFGEVQVHSSWIGRPCRSSSGMTSTPPGSTATTLAPYASCSLGDVGAGDRCHTGILLIHSPAGNDAQVTNCCDRSPPGAGRSPAALV